MSVENKQIIGMNIDKVKSVELVSCLKACT